MQLKILGSAAGGGFPQWNCACSNCARFRSGKIRAHARTQTQIAIRQTSGPWCLINASPDLRSQILTDSQFNPQREPRHSPISAVVLTGAEADQVLGLLHLREFQPLRIYSTAAVQNILRRDNSLFRTLERSEKQAEWITIRAGERTELKSPDGSTMGLRIEALSLGGDFPSYAKVSPQARIASNEAVMGFYINGESGGEMFCAPSVPCIEPAWHERWRKCRLLLLDGTFWSDDELLRVRGGKTAREMCHAPISGPGGSLEALARLKDPRKIFIHINNTNPILDEESPEHRQVIDAGFEIAHDGMQIEI